MKSHYNHIAGRSLERLAALSDGIFAVAMTLLVLDLRVPGAEMVRSAAPIWSPGALAHEAELGRALLGTLPHLLPYVMSFVTLGMFWIGQQTQFDFVARCDRTFSWLQLIFLLGVSVMPFSTALLAAYLTCRLALVAYWLNLLFLGLVLLRAWFYARSAGLLSEACTPEIHRLFTRRIVLAQLFYAASVALGAIHVYVSIALLVALQINSAIALKRTPLARF